MLLLQRVLLFQSASPRMACMPLLHQSPAHDFQGVCILSHYIYKHLFYPASSLSLLFQLTFALPCPQMVNPVYLPLPRVPLRQISILHVDFLSQIQYFFLQTRVYTFCNRSSPSEYPQGTSPLSILNPEFLILVSESWGMNVKSDLRNF